MKGKIKKALTGSGKPVRAVCAANRTMKTQVLYHKAGRKDKQNLLFYIPMREMGLTAMIFIVAISAPFLAACI